MPPPLSGGRGGGNYRSKMGRYLPVLKIGRMGEFGLMRRDKMREGGRGGEGRRGMGVMVHL